MRGEFYKMDFRAWNMGTVDLTLEQEAAYLRLCHAMYDVGGPVPNSPRFLMSIFRCGNVKAASLVQALIDLGKVAVTRDGKLFNHRVSEELADRERVSAARRQSGEKGGSAPRRQGRHEGGEPRVSAEWTPSDPRVTPEWTPSEGRVTSAKSLFDNDVNEANASTPGSREEKSRVYTPKAPKGAEPEGFAAWWEAYPKRDGVNPRAAAAARYAQAVKAGVLPETLLVAVRAYAAELQRTGKAGTEYVKQAQFWLSPKDRHWEDYARKAQAGAERQAGTAPGGEEYIASLSEERWRGHVRDWKNRGGYWPLQKVGCPPPDSPKTKVPRPILIEFGLFNRSMLAA